MWSSSECETLLFAVWYWCHRTMLWAVTSHSMCVWLTLGNWNNPRLEGLNNAWDIRIFSRLNTLSSLLIDICEKSCSTLVARQSPVCVDSVRNILSYTIMHNLSCKSGSLSKFAHNSPIGWICLVVCKDRELCWFLTCFANSSERASQRLVSDFLYSPIIWAVISNMCALVVGARFSVVNVMLSGQWTASVCSRVIDSVVSFIAGTLFTWLTWTMMDCGRQGAAYLITQSCAVSSLSYLLISLTISTWW